MSDFAKELADLETFENQLKKQKAVLIHKQSGDVFKADSKTIQDYSRIAIQLEAIQERREQIKQEQHAELVETLRKNHAELKQAVTDKNNLARSLEDETDVTIAQLQAQIKEATATLQRAKQDAAMSRLTYDQFCSTLAQHSLTQAERAHVEGEATQGAKAS